MGLWTAVAFWATVGGAVASGALFVHVWGRRGEPGATSFAGILAGATLWGVCYAVALVTFDPIARLALEVPMWLGKSVIAVSWLGFALAFSGRDGGWARRGLTAVAAGYVGIVLLVATNPAHHLLWSNYRIVGSALATVQYDYGPLFLIVMGYAYVTVGVGLLIVVETATEGDRYLLPVAMLALATSVPVGANLLWVLDRTMIPGLDPTPATLLVTAGGFAYALFAGDVLQSMPAARRVGRRGALDHVGHPIVLVDAGGRLVHYNSAAADRFGVDAEVLGSPVDEVVGVEWPVEPGRREVELRIADGRRRHFELTVSDISESDDASLGSTLLFHDVTERQFRMQRLDVMRRVLRHNLRNEMNVVRGHLEIAHSDAGTVSVSGENAPTSSTVADSIRTARRHVDDVIDLTERVQDAEEFVDSDSTVAIITLDSVVGTVAEAVASSRPDCTVAVEAEGATVRIALDTFEMVLTRALEMAASGADHVTVTAVVDDGDVVVTVEGEGLAIPDEEWAAVLRGRETELVHASGLGLWLVKWGVMELGGEVTPIPSGLRARIPQPSSDTLE